MDEWGVLVSISSKVREISSLHNMQPEFESMKISIQMTPGAVFPRVKRPRREGNHSLPFLPRFDMSELLYSLCYSSTRVNGNLQLCLQMQHCAFTLYAKVEALCLMLKPYMNKILFRPQFMWRICSLFWINNVYFSL